MLSFTGDWHNRGQICSQLADVTAIKSVTEPYPGAARLQTVHIISAAKTDRAGQT